MRPDAPGRRRAAHPGALPQWLCVESRQCSLERGTTLTLPFPAAPAQLPTVCLCGGRSCKQHEGKEVAWTSFTPAAPAAAASPFAKLLAGGGGGGEQQAPAANKRRRKKQ